MSQQVQIVLDSDVIIHFIKGNCLSILPKILPQYKYVHYCPVKAGKSVFEIVET